MRQSPYSEAGSFLPSQEIYRILWHPTARHCVQNSCLYPDPGETPSGFAMPFI